jgi:hypothetical protein
MHRLPYVCTLVCLILLAAHVRAADSPINFSRDIHPILSENCFACHGPDEKARKAKLRLDTQEGAFKKHDDTAAIVPKEPDKSEVIRRILTTDPDDHMPPADSGKKLTPRQIDLLKQWIAQGADYKKHWSFEPIQSPPVPPISNPKSTIRNPIDNFILARLQKEGLTPSPEATKSTLLRRVTLDLTGLTPSPQELDAFLADNSPNA